MYFKLKCHGLQWNTVEICIWINDKEDPLKDYTKITKMGTQKRCTMQTLKPQELTKDFLSSTCTGSIIFRYPVASLTKITCHWLWLHLKTAVKTRCIVQFFFYVPTANSKQNLQLLQSGVHYYKMHNVPCKRVINKLAMNWRNWIGNFIDKFTCCESGETEENIHIKKIPNHIKLW